MEILNNILNVMIAGLKAIEDLIYNSYKHRIINSNIILVLYCFFSTTSCKSKQPEDIFFHSGIKDFLKKFFISNYYAILFNPKININLCNISSIMYKY